MNQPLYEKLVMQTQINYQQYYSMYAQGKTPIELTDRSPLPYDEQIKNFAARIKEADHIIVGGASGLSAAGGGDFYYKATPNFKKHFKRYYDKYHFGGAFAGAFYKWQDRGEYWGFMSTFLHTTLHAPVRSPYKDLQEILKDKDYFVVTTNQDTQAIKAFPEKKVAQIQGDHRFFQCSNRCTDQVWDSTKMIDDMYEYLEEHDTTAIPDEMIPRCPNCGSEAFPWVRGYGNFLEGERYRQEYQKISDDLVDHKNSAHILFLELGVGRMTPMFIQKPFWTLTNTMPGAYDIMVNRDYQFLPKDIEDKGSAIKGDIAQVLTDVRKEFQSLT